MIKHFILTTMLLGMGWCSIAQNDSSTVLSGTPMLTEKKGNKLLIKTDLLPLLDVYSHGSYRFGMEFCPTERIGIYGEWGGYFPNYNTVKNISGFVTKGELRLYGIPNAQGYLSVEHHYKSQEYDYNDTIKISGVTPYSKDYRMKKRNHMINLKYGWQTNVGRFGYDMYAGLGVRFKNAECVGLTNDEADNRETFDSMSLPLINACEEKIYPNFTLGFRLTYNLIWR